MKLNAEANASLIAAAPEMLECMIYDFRANVKQFGLETAKKLKSCYVIERATGLPIEEVSK